MAPSMLERVLMHVVFPPRLPDRQDSPGHLENVQVVLADFALKASIRLRDVVPQHGSQFDCLRRSLQACKNVNLGGTISKLPLVTALQNLEAGRDDVLILHIAEQNAALLIRHQREDGDDRILFESFETSAVSEDVLAAEGSLEWDFPGCAVSIPASTFAKPHFQEELATCISQASKESIKRFAARTNKAGSFVIETRDTVDPALITSMLMTVLEVNGARSFPPILRKRVRDDVCWSDGARKPWRRSPYWLVLRVGIQRHLSALHGGEVGRALYKFLMCQILSDLLEESLKVLPSLDIELVSFLNTKLCRRLTKLELDKESASPKVYALYDYMLRTLGPSFDKITTNAVAHVEDSWTQFKKAHYRYVPTLPWRSDQRHLYLTLPNSGRYIQRVLDAPCYPAAVSNAHPSLNVSSAVNKEWKVNAERYFHLSEMETDIEEYCKRTPISDTGYEDRCILLAKKIEEYLTTIGDAYDKNPEQKSVMLLTVMELWMSMEQCAIRLYGILQDYHPIFPGNILDVLQLPRLKDMERMQSIRSYLHERLSKSGHLTIFDDPTRGCFGERYFEESTDSSKLEELRRKIETKANDERQQKEQEWRTRKVQYEQLIVRLAESSHILKNNESRPNAWSTYERRCERSCPKCQLQRAVDHSTISTLEYLLPSDDLHTKVVVFEMACPKAFAAYRQATWRILATLSVPSPPHAQINTTTLQSTAPFLDLSRELRDQILNYVVLAERDTPSPQKSTEERREVDDIPYRSKNQGRGIHYTKSLGRIELFPTLLVSHQLRIETLAAIKRLPTKYSYKLDIAVVSGDQLWPTWLSIPTITTRLDKLSATIRTCDLRKCLLAADDFFLEESSWYGRPEAVWSFYDLLERFLTVGPSTEETEFWDMRGLSEARKTSIKILDLDVISESPGPMEEFPDGVLGNYKLLNPQFMADFMTSEIDSLLGMKGMYADFGAILYERMGTIRLFRDGILDREWNLSELLQQLFDEDPCDSKLSVRGFNRPRAVVWETRMKFGLPSVPGENPLESFRSI